VGVPSGPTPIVDGLPTATPPPPDKTVGWPACTCPVVPFAEWSPLGMLTPADESTDATPTSRCRCGAPLTELTCAVTTEPPAVLPPPTWAVPVEPVAVLPLEPVMLSGTVADTLPAELVALTEGALPVEPTWAVPTDPVATLPPSARTVAAEKAAENAAAATAATRNRRFIGRPPF